MSLSHRVLSHPKSVVFMCVSVWFRRISLEQSSFISLFSLTVPRCNLLRSLEENGLVIICMCVDREDMKNFCEIGVTVKRVCMR